MNKNGAVLALSMVVALTGCSSVEKASKAVGSTGTGIIGGVVVGAGVGVACDKLGGNRAACIAAGMAAGALAGKLLSDLDDHWEKSVPVSRCGDVQKKLGYKPTDKSAKGQLSVDFAPKTAVVKKGEKIQPTIKVDLAAPQGQAIATKLKVNDTISERAIKKECGGDYNLPLAAITAEKDGPQYLDVALLDAATNQEIAHTKACYSVSANGSNVCTVETKPAEEPAKPAKKTKKSSRRA
jgi:hypothetical protein